MKKKKHTISLEATGLPVRIPREFRDKLQQVSMLLKMQRMAQADHLCQEVLSKYPQEPQAWYLRGGIAHQSNKHSNAIGYFQEALRLMPDNVQFWHALAAVYMAIEDFSEAAAALEHAINLRPDDVEGHYRQGIAWASMHVHPQAIQALTRVLALEPRHWQAVFNRGLLHQTMGNDAAAIDDFQQTVELQPAQASVLYSLGISLHRLEYHEEAVQAYQRAIAMQPGYAAAYNARGATLLAMGQYQAALQHFDRALALHPLLEDAYLNKGLALYEMARYAEALDFYRKLQGSGGGAADVYFHMGNALQKLEQHYQAIECYQQARVMGFDTPDVRLGQVSCYRELGENRAAVQLLLGLLGSDAAQSDVQLQLAFCYIQLHQYELALDHADNALQEQPGWAQAHYYRGLAFHALSAYSDALDSFNAALAVDPVAVDALYHRGLALDALGRRADGVEAFAAVLEINPQYPCALGTLVNSKLHRCQWDGYAQHVQRLEKMVREGLYAVEPFTFLSLSHRAEDQLMCAVTYAKNRFSSAESTRLSARYRHESMRVAYLSADLDEHATAYLMAELFERHDRQNFEIYAYSFGLHDRDNPSPMRKRLERAFEHFHDVTDWPDERVAQHMREQEIDIAVDLKGYTGQCRTRIFALRPAPIQVNYLGYPGTMGADFIDYIVGDDIVTPPEHDMFYSEKIVRLPGSYQVNDRQRQIAPEAPSRAACGLPARGFVFCCFNNNYKINPQVFDIWMLLLQRVPGSVLWLLQDNPDVVQNLRAEAQARGVEGQRLVFAARVPLAVHLARHQHADLFLDTLPYNAHTTTSDALWAGLPVLTCLGTTFAGRVAASLLHAAGMPELITQNLQEYEARAYQLATDAALLAATRAKLQARRDTCALFDSDATRQNLEAAYRSMYQEHWQEIPA